MYFSNADWFTNLQGITTVTSAPDIPAFRYSFI